MTPVFLDTVGLLALWDQNDQWHSAAVRAYSLKEDHWTKEDDQILVEIQKDRENAVHQELAE